MKRYLQTFGRHLTSMVMPNIGAFIAWGLITALFIPTGWIPNEKLVNLVGPMITYLLPLLIAYSGGKLVAGERGGVIGVIATMGIIVGSDIPMFMGAMIMGPLAASIIRLFDRSVHGKIPAGFEMLVNNFSLGIIGVLLACVNYLVVGGVIETFINVLSTMVEGMINAKLLPLISIIVEPAKVLFLNNAVNHGIFTPLATGQVEVVGKSILYLIETNPGPGLGVLVAYMLHTKGKVQKSTYGASIIHFFGGIHEIYFPYVLMKPILTVAVILGGMTGVTLNLILGNGLIGPPSPGSIFALSIMSTKGIGIIFTFISIIGATTVSYLLSAFFLKVSKDDFADDSLEVATSTMKSMKAESKGTVATGAVSTIVFACDAGMGSSVMGSTMLQKKLKEAGMNISVTHKSFSEVTQADTFIVTQDAFVLEVKKKSPNAEVVAIDNFMNKAVYDNVVSDLKSRS